MSEQAARIKHGAILVVIIILGVTLFILPTRTRLHAAQGQLKTTLQRLQNAEEDRDRLIRADLRLREVNRRVEDEFPEVPQFSNIPSLMKMISSHMDALPLSENTVNSGTETQTGDLLSLRLQIKSVGDFDSVFELLTRIESLPRLQRIAEISISTTRDEVETGLVTAEISLDTFYCQSHDDLDMASAAGKP